MRTLFLTLAQALGLVLLADFVAGIVHWLEDAYGSEDTPVIGPLLIRPNILHHHQPRHFTKLTWWQSSWDLVLIGSLILAAACWWGFLSWQLILFLVLVANANQVHKWAHRTRAENGRIVSFLQDIRVLQTPRHHALHHTDPKNTYYCPITNILNPHLERLRFWSRLESIIARITGVRHRHDTSNRGQGPGPAWLATYRNDRRAHRETAASANASPPHMSAPVTPPRPSRPSAACDCAACPARGRCAHSNLAGASATIAATTTRADTTATLSAPGSRPPSTHQRLYPTWPRRA